MKKNRIIAMLLGTALLVCGCQQTSKATDEEKRLSQKRIQLRQKKTHIRGN